MTRFRKSAAERFLQAAETIASPPGGIISVPADRGESNDTVFVAVSNRYYSTPATFAVIKSRVSGAATQPDEEEKKKEEETILTPVDQKDAASLKEPSGSKGISGTTVDALPQSGSIGKVNASDFSITGNFTKKRLTIRFQKVSGATNYVIAWKKAAAKSWNYATCGNTDRFVIRGVKRGSLLDIRICAYVHGSRGPWSNIYRCFFEKASASASRKGTRLTVTFKKTKGASGYELQWATNKRMKGYKTKSVKNGQRIVLSKLKRSGKYYIRWRPYKRYRAKKYLGLYSSVKKV